MLLFCYHYTRRTKIHNTYVSNVNIWQRQQCRNTLLVSYIVYMACLCLEIPGRSFVLITSWFFFLVTFNLISLELEELDIMLDIYRIAKSR